MSEEVTKLYREGYQRGIEMLAQQIQGATDGTIRTESMTSEREFFDQVGLQKLQPKQGRSADIPQNDTPLARRSVTAEKQHVRDFIDEQDKLKTLNDPTNAYSQALAAAAVRSRDKIVVDAALGTAYTGKTGATTVTLPSTQKIAAASAGFTFAKLKAAVTKLKGRHGNMPGDMITCLWTAKQEEELIDQTQVASADYSNKKVLVDGELKSFYGVNFRRLEDVHYDDGTVERMLPYAGTTRSCILYVKSGLLLATRQNIYGRLDWLPEKESWQVSAGIDAGATRMQEVKVVQIDVLES